MLGSRIVDLCEACYDEAGNLLADLSKAVLHEVKTGCVPLSGTLREKRIAEMVNQAHRDAQLQRKLSPTAKVVWHFLPSDGSACGGPPLDLLPVLDELGIEMRIVFPRRA